MSLLLAPLGWLYGGIMRLRRALYHRGIFASYQLPGRVISVGNLEAGGTGKSPVVMAVAEELLKRGDRPAILTRGYRSGLKPTESAALLGATILMPPQSEAAFHADEATMQARRLETVPVIIGAQRWEAAQRYLAKHEAPTHWILDDGFQHIRLKRQLDIVLLHAEKPFANGHCLPAGRLREFPGTLRFAHLVLLTRAQSGAVPTVLPNMSAPTIPLPFVNGSPVQMLGPSQAFTSQRGAVLALGIAHPERVFHHCKAQGYPITEQLTTADHELFPLEKLRELAKKTGAILTTEKDFWRQPEALRALNHPVYVIPLEVRFPATFDLSKVLP